MRRACEWKVKGIVAFWRDWQKVEPRVFEDTEISDADAARYSLLLVAGPARTRSRSGWPRESRSRCARTRSSWTEGLPRDGGRVSLVHPSPLNPERYVAILAGTSPGGLWFAEWQGGEWDFQIVDGRSAAAATLDPPGRFPERGRIASGYFDEPGGWTRPSSSAGTRRSARRPRRCLRPSR